MSRGRLEGSLCCSRERETYQDDPPRLETQRCTNYLLLGTNLWLMVLVALLVFKSLTASETSEKIGRTADSAFAILQDIQKPGGTLANVDFLSNQTATTIYPTVIGALNIVSTLLEQVQAKNYTDALDTMVNEAHSLIDRTNGLFLKIFQPPSET